MTKIKRIDGNSKKYLNEVLDTDFRSSKGSLFMTRLEAKFAEIFDVKYAISHVNGTATLHSALAAIGVKPGDEVIVPPLTMSSTTLCVLQQYAVPIFADVDPNTFLIDPQSVKERITERTKAVITVSLFGLPPEMDEIRKICDDHNLVLIEDNAQSFLGKYKGKIVGSWGDFSSYSFQSSKHMTSGEGGMLTTNDEDLANNARRFSSLGYAGVGAKKGKITKEDIQDPEYSRHVSVGYNYRLAELCSAVALSQLERLDELVQQRQISAKYFIDVINKHTLLKPQFVPNYTENSYWTVVAVLDIEKVSWKEFRSKFKEFGGDNYYAAWKLTYQEPLFQNFPPQGMEVFYNEPIYQGKLQDYNSSICPNAEYLQKRLVQFKTNYWDINDAIEQSEILDKTLSYFEKIG